MAILLVNQHTVPIFIDVANAIAGSAEVVLFTGHIERGGQPLSSRIRTIQSISYKRRSTISRLLSWIVFSIHYFFFLLVCKKPSHILVVTNPPLAPFITSIVSRWRKFSYHILLYDLYPEALVQAGLVKENHFIFRLWQRGNNSMLGNAETVFTLSDSMKKALVPYMSDDKKIRVIHNWADTSYIHPVPKSENRFLRKHQLQDKFIVMYSGNMGLTHDLESLIEAADLLKQNKNIIFILIGDGGKRVRLQQMVILKSLTNVLFLPYQDADQFPHSIAAADVGIVTLGVGAEGISVPSKTYINLAAGVCVLGIAPVTSELSRLIVAHNAGQVCEPGHPEEVAAMLTTIFHDHQKLHSYKQNALKASRSYTAENANLYIREMLGN